MLSVMERVESPEIREKLGGFISYEIWRRHDNYIQKYGKPVDEPIKITMSSLNNKLFLRFITSKGTKIYTLDSIRTYNETLFILEFEGEQILMTEKEAKDIV